MPEFKYTGAPTVTPEEARRTAAIPEIRETFPEPRLTVARGQALAAVGEGVGVLGNSMRTVGAAIHSLGKTLDTAGNELWTRAEGLKKLEGETNANNAAIDWNLDQVKRDNKFSQLKGTAANSGALAAHLQS